MSFKTPASLVETRIAQARAEGAFENLPGEGKPLRLDDLDGLSEDQRMEALVLRSSGEVSPEVALLREISALRGKLAGCAEPTRGEALREELRRKATELSGLIAQRRADDVAARKSRRGAP